MIRFIDLFAGIGGIRKGFELACDEYGEEYQCVFTSEIKPHAIEILQQNHPGEPITGDITKVDAADIPDFDILLAGFPCQAFSAAGNRDGFADTRGTLFFDVARIIKAKKPKGFILENVEGLVNHDGGNTLNVIVHNLTKAGYRVAYKVLNSADFGVPQERKRIYIVGVRKDLSEKAPSLDDFTIKNVWLKKVWEITRRMAEWPINLQVKAGVVHKIRPGVWYSTNPGKFSMFRSMEHFLSAIEETVYQNPKTHDAGAMWRRNFLNHYQEFYGVRLNIPRWDEVVEEYGGANII